MHLGWIDIVVLVAYLVSAIVVGLLVSGRAKGMEAYLLGDRDLPWWAILGSIVATETSTATVLSVPGEACGLPGGLISSCWSHIWFRQLSLACWSAGERREWKPICWGTATCRGGPFWGRSWRQKRARLPC